MTEERSPDMWFWDVGVLRGWSVAVLAFWEFGGVEVCTGKVAR